MSRRIIPISSGKGGVGKTTFAINFALGLSRFGRTVLVDLDTGTSSVRNTLASPVDRDLYHFARKGARLDDCVTPLGQDLDPRGEYRNFGFVAGPRHFLDDLANPDARLRRRLARAVQTLDADFVVLDLRAGLDAQVLDFLPHTNSGVLIVAPHHPAATLAASEIVKAQIYRSLRILFHENSPLFANEPLSAHRQRIVDLLDRTEDVYDDTVANLESFLDALQVELGPHPMLRVLDDYLGMFRVHYVLNLFDGIESSYQEAVEPFVRNLARHVSPRLSLSQLGWIVADDAAMRQALTERRPVLLGERKAIRSEASDPATPSALDRLADIEADLLGRTAPRPTTGRRRPRSIEPDAFEFLATEDLLAGQLRSLAAMVESRSQDTVRQNFAYLVQRARQVMAGDPRAAEFGARALASPEQLTRWFLAWQQARTEPQASSSS